MEAILTTVLATALVAVLLLVFVAMPIAVLVIVAATATRLWSAAAGFLRALRKYWAAAARATAP